MTEETTSEQLAEIEGQGEQYTPPEGWVVLRSGELLQPGDQWVSWDGTVQRPDILHGDGATVSGGRYIRRIEQQPQPEPQATQYAPPEGWRLLETHEELDIPGRDQYVRGPNRYIRPIEPEPQPADTVDELRSEVSYLQNLLGESRQRVTHLEELVTSLQREVAVAKEELTIAAAVSHQLQIELDAAQQVPVDSLDLQQLRLRLADMTLDRDTCKDAYDSTFDDLLTTRETTKAEAVEAITEWLQHFRGCNSPSLALLLLEALPHIMRSLTGLNPEEIE